MYNIEEKWGFPTIQREQGIKEKCEKSNRVTTIEYMGKNMELPIVSVRIELPIYRIENGRTVNLQKEYIATHPDVAKDFFTKEPESIAVQEAQHSLLKTLVEEQGLMKTFRNNVQQTDPLIATPTGIIVNGNRRLCAWRELYYSNPDKYKYFQTIELAILPNNDKKGIRDLEIRHQLLTDIKADYHWHEKSVVIIDEMNSGRKDSEIANKMNMNKKDVHFYMDAYHYAEEYLKRNGIEDQWSKVDNYFYAFKQIAESRKKLCSMSEKTLFEELAFELISSKQIKQGERTFLIIDKIQKFIKNIKSELIKKYPISVNGDSSQIDDLLGTNDSSNEDVFLAEKIKEIDSPKEVIDIVNSVIEDCSAKGNETNKSKYVLEELTKANTIISRIPQNLTDLCKKDGVSNQIESIEYTLKIIKNWLKQ